MHKLLLIWVLALAIAGCQQAETPRWDKAKKEKVLKEVTAMLHNYFSDIKKEGLTAEFRYLDNSPDFFWVPPGYQTVIYYDSVYKTLLIHDQGLQSVAFYWSSLEVHPLSEEIANYTGIVKGTIVDTAGQVNQVHMIETGTAIKRAEGWKILSGQSRNLE